MRGFYRSGQFDTLQQRNRHIGSFDPHHAFLRISVTQKIDAALPDDALVDDGELLVDTGSEQDVDAFSHQKPQNILHEKVIVFRKILLGAGHHGDADRRAENLFQMFQHQAGPRSLVMRVSTIDRTEPFGCHKKTNPLIIYPYFGRPTLTTHFLISLKWRKQTRPCPSS